MNRKCQIVNDIEIQLVSQNDIDIVTKVLRLYLIDNSETNYNHLVDILSLFNGKYTEPSKDMLSLSYSDPGLDSKVAHQLSIMSW